MKRKQLLALLLTVSVSTAAASILAEGSVSGPAPDPADLPTADAWTGSDVTEYDTGSGVTEYDMQSVVTESDVTRYVTESGVTGYDTESGVTEGDTEFVESELYAVADASAASEEPEAVATSADTSEAVATSADTSEAVATSADASEAVATSADASDAVATSADASEVAPTPETVDAPTPETVPDSADAPEAVVTPDDTPEASGVAGPDDGGIRPERKLDKNEQRDARKRDQIVQSATETTETLAEISFAEVESRTREDNMTVRALRESVNGLEGMDYEKSEEDLLKILNGLSMQQDLLSMASGSEPLAQSFAVSSLQSQYDSLYNTFEKLHDGTTRRSGQDAIEQMRDAMNQVVMGAETLYIALVAMENQHTALTRQLDALNRTVEEMELRYNLGQISALALNQTKAGRRALVSGLETLEMNIKTYKMRLENMLGASLTGEIKLGQLPAVTEAQIAALDAERDFAAAHEKSYELYAAARTLQDAKETFLSSAEQYHHNENNSSYKMARGTWVAAQDTYNVTVRGYELKFRTLYEQTLDYYQVWNAAKDALETQKQEYQAKELQYKQGNISNNTLLSAKDALREKEEAVQTAANNLFSAYNNYCWAAQTGILN